ncbi:MAG: ATP-binding protein [Candidatus Coatesbacteria bacterium]
MKIEGRQIDEYLWDEEIIGRKMVFLSGPRQVGKTTYARGLLARGRKGGYFSWDNPLVRRAYAADPFFFLKDRGSAPDYLAIFDEIHKRHRWKDILKGIYDSIDPSSRILVTGSARLEWFRKSGDSLVGRYAHFHMLPLSVTELAKAPFADAWLGRATDWKAPWASLKKKLETAPPAGTRAIYDHLFTFGGFPEPASRASERFLRKWQSDYLSLLLTEDLRDATGIRAVDTVESLVALLPGRVGSPLSVSALSRDLETTHPSVRNYLLQLEKLWLTFSIRPWSRRLGRVLRKEKKAYFTHWPFAGEDQRVHENMLASILLRACLAWSDAGMGEAALWYVRTFEGREADFLVVLDGKPAVLVEAKWSETSVDTGLRNIAARIGIPLVQVVHTPGILRVEDDIIVVSADRFLRALP